MIQKLYFDRIFFTAIFVLLLFININYLLKYSYKIPNSNHHKENLKNFKQIALYHGSDKVTTHDYDVLYDFVLGPLRKEKLNFLEIGLGCNMLYGPGKSIGIWKEFLPNSNISIMEYDEPCALKFKDKVKNMFIGDQSDLNFIRKIGENFGLFDVIVDDGGHSRKQQINSLIGLWPFVKNGGIYVIEDIFFSFVNQYNDNSESSFDLIMELIILMNNPNELGILPVVPSIKIYEHTKLIYRELQMVSCFHRACVLFKKH